MTNEPDNLRLRREELQACRLLYGLTLEEQAEYDKLVTGMPNDKQTPFEELVAKLDVAHATANPERLPAHLRQTIEHQAQIQLRAPARDEPLLARPNSRPALLKYVPWLVSAACIVWAVGVWNASRQSTSAPNSVAAERAELIANADDLISAQWTPGPTPVDGSTGDIVWSSRYQRGYMRLRGLPTNIPTLEQYQLWIFDKNQSERTPVDGGVFDVASAGEVIIPIDSKLRVHEATMFAVTLEKPGGVVVSSRERLLLVAKVD